jgi:hypothetical protein
MACVIALAIVLYGALDVPVPVVSLPVVADTKIPVLKFTTHGSLFGSSPSLRQSPVPPPALQKWYPVLHAIPHGPPSPALPMGTPPSVVHVALPVPEVSGVAQFMPHDPQWFGSVLRSVHAPPQFVGVGALQPLPHWPAVHVAAVPPSQTLVQFPQCCGSVGSTHAPLHSSEVGGAHPASPPEELPPSEPLGASPVVSADASLPHALLSTQVPNVSVPQPVNAVVITAPPTQMPRVTTWRVRISSSLSVPFSKSSPRRSVPRSAAPRRAPR